jgi:CHAD domain-containing protein
VSPEGSAAGAAPPIDPSDEPATEDPSEARTERRAGDFLAPVLFALVAAVRREAARVGSVEGASDPEAIHDFRVALRRLRTVLRPARALYGKRRLREIGDELRRFAQATGALRDEEVLRETLAGLDLPGPARARLDAWLVQRARQERTRRRLVRAVIAAVDPHDAGGPTLGDALAHLERRLGRRREDLGASVLAEAAVESASSGVAALVGVRASDVAGMHALRIRYKRLRYTAELFAPVLGERAAVLAKGAARMQKRLGELHDLDEALARVRRARSLSSPTRAAVSRALRGARARRSAVIARDLVDERARFPGSGAEAPPPDPG